MVEYARVAAEIMDFHQRVALGKSGLQVSRIGLASSYGAGADAVEEAYNERGINYLYWGTMRRAEFGEGIRRLARRNRDDLVIVVQSYARLAGWMTSSFERALHRLNLDHADILLLGLHNRPPSRRIMDAARRLRERGRARFLAVSCHRRSTFQRYIRDGVFDVLMFRYNAAHRGAEKEILPFLDAPTRQGTVSYTATRWGTLINAKKCPKGERVPRASDCYRFVLSRPGIDLCLAGPANIGQMREALEALDRGPMSEEELAWMRRIGDHIHKS
jgi:aryl-alcohol dehydrogenase-like predicted oxidoreductase